MDGTFYDFRKCLTKPWFSVTDLLCSRGQIPSKFVLVNLTVCFIMISS